MTKILLIEDDADIARGLISGLSMQGMSVEWFSDAKTGEAALHNAAFDAVLLDLSLPNGDGMQVLDHWRSEGITTPVLIITARDAIANRVAGLNAGADDYLVKPFALDEMVARIWALIRRSQGRAQSLMEFGSLSFDAQNRQAFIHGKPIELNNKELTLLEQFLAAPKMIHSRAALEDKLYGWSSEVDSNTIEVHIHHLRKKLGSDFILTKRGIGYYLNPAWQAD